MEVNRLRVLSRWEPMEAFETFEYDVLIVGAGGAGLRAVIAAREAGLAVGVVCKSLLAKRTP